VRRDVRVAILSRSGQAVGFFPYEQLGRIGNSAAYPLSSLHGVITSESNWSPYNLLHATGLKTIRFDHWMSGQEEMHAAGSVVAECAQADLRRGFDVYLQSLRQQRPKMVAEIRRKCRKLARDVGEVHCERTSDEAVLQQLVAWKSQQCARTQVANLFSFAWPRELARLLLEEGTDACRGDLWILKAGEQVLAVNYVLRSRTVAHGWFMAYDPQFHRYSPGLVLVLKLFEACARLGITTFDLGKGVTGFKERLMTESAYVLEGALDTRPVARAVWSRWLKTRDWLRSSRLRDTAHRVDRILTNTRRVLGRQH